MSKLSHLKGYLQNSGGYFLDQAMVSFGNFAIAILLGRLLGPATFGVFSLGWMALLFVSSLQQAFILTPMLSLYPKQAPGYVGGLTRLQMVLAVLPLLIAVLLLVCLPQRPAYALLLDLALPTALASLGHQIYDFVRKTMLVRQALRPVQRLDGAVLLLQLGLVLALMGLGWLSATAALYALAMAYFLPAMPAFLKIVLTEPRSPHAALIRQHWAYGKWLCATALLQWFGGNFFILTGGALLGTTAMGAIRMAQTITGMLNVLLLAVENFVPVRAALALQTGGMQALRSYLQKVGVKTGLLFFPMLIVLAWLSPVIIDLVFGAAYLPYAFVLRGFAVLYCLVFGGTILRFFYRTVGDTREIFFAYVLSAVVSMALAEPLVQSWGLGGVVAGLIVSQILICGWLLFRISSPTYRISL